MFLFKKHQWFSVLMALGITTVLMIMVTGLSMIYVREMKISRLSYDEILTQSAAEWMFEYGMLKIKNHADGFADEVIAGSGENADFDGKMFALSTPRSKGMQMDYKIEAQSTSGSFQIAPNGVLTIPLGVWSSDDISGKSKDPQKSERIDVTQWLNVSGISNEVTWTIAATAKFQEDGKGIDIPVALAGTGAFNPETLGVLTMKRFVCYIQQGDESYKSKEQDTPCDTTDKEKEAPGQEMYFYTTTWKVSDFVKDFIKEGKKDFGSGNGKLTNVEFKNFYLILKNNSTETKTAEIKSETPFALPQYKITATAQKWDAKQVFEFWEDKSEVYAFLNYGYYEPPKQGWNANGNTNNEDFDIR